MENVNMDKIGFDLSVGNRKEMFEALKEHSGIEQSTRVLEYAMHIAMSALDLYHFEKPPYPTPHKPSQYDIIKDLI
jgi:hypothetical protein